MVRGARKACSLLLAFISVTCSFCFPQLTSLSSRNVLGKNVKVDRQFLIRHPFVQRQSVQHLQGVALGVRRSCERWMAETAADDGNRRGVHTIQILMSDTGGGHRASANALRDAFSELYPGKIECDIVDIYTDYGPCWPYNSYVSMYKIAAEYTFLWKAFYEFGCTSFGMWLNELLLDWICFEPFKNCMARPSGTSGRRANMVVSVHPLCQDLPLKILSYLDSRGRTKTNDSRITPFATVVTDLAGAHPTWFNSGVDKCFVPTEILYQCAIDRKLNPSQIVQHGLPIRRGFWGDSHSGKGSDEEEASSEHENLMEKLGMHIGKPSVLIVGGGDGMGGIVATATTLGKRLSAEADNNDLKYQMVVVCGKNERAQHQLSAMEWGNGVMVHVKGFVDNMDEWMRACDTIITKAGPGTIAEASICGLPCMLSSFLPGQEEGNVPFVEKSGFGTYSARPDTIAETVSLWLRSPEHMKSMRVAALQAARPHATLDIAEDLAEMLFATERNKL